MPEEEMLVSALRCKDLQVNITHASRKLKRVYIFFSLCDVHLRVAKKVGFFHLSASYFFKFLLEMRANFITLP